MTAGALIDSVDQLRPNQYSTAQKLQWLQRLDAQIRRELRDTHEAAGGESVLDPEAGEGPYTAQSALLVRFPYDTELYTAYLFCQIDLHNGEISRYNQSLALLGAAWRQLADAVNRQSLPKSGGGWKL